MHHADTVSCHECGIVWLENAAPDSDITVKRNRRHYGEGKQGSDIKVKRNRAATSR